MDTASPEPQLPALPLLTPEQVKERQVRKLYRVHTAVIRRLREGSATEEDNKDLARARLYRDMKRRGHSDLEIARAMGMQDRSVRGFVTGKLGRALLDYLTEREVAKTDKAMDDVVAQARRDFAALTPKSVKFLDWCMREKKDGTPEDVGLFQWAAAIVAKGAGLTEPSTAVRPVIQINVGSIKIEQAQVNADDEMARQAAITVDAEVVE